MVKDRVELSLEIPDHSTSKPREVHSFEVWDQSKSETVCIITDIHATFVIGTYCKGHFLPRRTSSIGTAEMREVLACFAPADSKESQPCKEYYFKGTR